MTIDYTEAHVLLDALTHLNHAITHGEEPWYAHSPADPSGPGSALAYSDAVRTAQEKVEQIIQNYPPDHVVPKERRTYNFEQAAVIVYETDWEGNCSHVTVCPLDSVDLPQMFTGLIDATDEEAAEDRENHGEVYERADKQEHNKWGEDFIRASCPGTSGYVQWGGV